MLDSSSKLVTGVLYGDLADLGNFDECLAAGPSGSSSADVQDGNGFTGRYSLASLALQTIVKPTPGPLQDGRHVRVRINSFAGLVAASGLTFILIIPKAAKACLLRDSEV